MVSLSNHSSVLTSPFDKLRAIGKKLSRIAGIVHTKGSVAARSGLGDIAKELRI